MSDTELPYHHDILWWQLQESCSQWAHMIVFTGTNILLFNVSVFFNQCTCTYLVDSGFQERQGTQGIASKLACSRHEVPGGGCHCGQLVFRHLPYGHARFTGVIIDNAMHVDPYQSTCTSTPTNNCWLHSASNLAFYTEITQHGII